jgi:UPF0755 protein
VRREADPPQVLAIPPGTSVSGIAARLYGAGLVRHPFVVRALVLARGDASRLRAGEYLLEGEMSLQQVVDKIVRGDVIRRDVTFPEGRNLEEMAAIAETRGIPAGAFLAAARDPAPIRDLDPAAADLEGYLFPDTYEVPPGPDAAAVLVARMTKRFRETVDAERPRIESSAMDLREIVTLASVVELETALPAERPRIAAVFLNRLRLGMPLQTDPTVIYAMRKAGTWDGNIRREDLAIDSPYNTYRNAGLPPGPIASPGRDAIVAVLEPAPTKDLYFVSRNDGSHHFSASLREHTQAVNYYQRRRGAPPPGPPPPSPSPVG